MTTSTNAVSTWTLDPVHSIAEFSVKHLMVATVKGRFLEMEGTIHIDEDQPLNSSVRATIQAASVDTGNQMRDDDLRADDFLGAAKFPTIRFVSTRVEEVDDDRWKVFGDLTIRDVTREVALDTELEGRAPGFDGKEHVGFTAETLINRKQFDLKYNAALETGGMVVGDRVKITLHIEAIKQGD
jgi:polyisoprenoid-binding protein YceI